MENDYSDIRVVEKVRDVLKWPTDTVEIDYVDPNDSSKVEYPHTIIVFFPGNPGLVGWYIPSLLNLVKRAGRGFAARGVSYAGHGTPDDIANVEKWLSRKEERDTDLAFTVDGQIVHKENYMDMLEQEMLEHPNKKTASRPRYIFLAHSIGCHMIQRLLIRRMDILRQTDLVLYMMPFSRMKSHAWSEYLLFKLSAMPEPVIGHAQSLMRVLAALPVHFLDTLLKGDITCPNGRRITVDLLQQVHFGRNWFELGMEEVRDLPEVPDFPAFRIIGEYCPICILFVGNDKWAPEFHIKDLEDLQAKGVIPKNIHTAYLPQLVHDYVVRPHMVVPVDDFCFDAIQKHVLEARNPQSRL
ncbi:chromosome 2 open reading frame 43 [Seminavis robusta]|uniref:Chromosome 2 open reading frame 43 n=1 Tax=Seminavis robusta TaxID=568900 RepID=A0A9N8ECC1_9STRA|nr:chromosome 2 open reading frame 43 [Seminavis robusta]|eukprot:Sro881_g215240.1 chromosome 2 open reading frame 43 (355) ;mRNA; f:24488-25659